MSKLWGSLHIADKKFVLIDDNSTTGRTFVGLKNFLEENGGEVVGYYALTTGQDQSEKMITTDGTWNKLLSLGLDEVKDFAEEEGIKREISREGLTERETQELIKQFGGKNTDSRRGFENVERSGRGGREIHAILDTKKKDGSAEKSEGIREGISYSLKDEYWKTDLAKTQLKTVEGWLRQAGNPESKKITDTASWYEGRIDGDDLFVIYSTEVANNPTILYEVKGCNAVLERDILLDLLEDEENGKSINRKPSFTQRLSKGNWVQNVNNSQNNLRHMGDGRNNQNAEILQGQSQSNGSPAFRNVVENLFRKQEKSISENGEEKYSLKRTTTKIKYSPTGIKLSQNEYSKFYQSTGTDYYMTYKTHKGLQYQSCVTDNSHILYIYEDGGFGNYKVVAKVDYKYDDVAKAITEVLDSEEHYKIAGVVNEILETYEVGRSGYTVYNAYTKKRSGSRGNGIVSERKQETNTRRAYGGGGRVSEYKRGTKGNTDTSLNESISHSLKGGMSATELFETVDDARKGKKSAISKLSKYVDNGAMSTELYNELIEKYGAIQSGEKPHRDVQVPQKTEKDKSVSKTVRTILEAKATPDEMLPTIEELVRKGEFSYDVYTDKEAISKAEENITKKGWETAKADWYKSVGNGEVSKKNTAEGWVIYNNAVNSGDVETALEVLNFMVKHQRSAAQALQATRILKKLSPETQLYGVQKSVLALQNELTDKYGDKAP